VAANLRANYRDVRHQIFAHKEAAEETEITALFSKGTNRELQHLIASLATLHEALWQLFMNGRKLALRPAARISMAGIRRRPKPKLFSNRAVQEAITHGSASARTGLFHSAAAASEL
jgi:hypothetical protein